MYNVNIAYSSWFKHNKNIYIFNLELDKNSLCVF